MSENSLTFMFVFTYDSGLNMSDANLNSALADLLLADEGDTKKGVFTFCNC